MKVEMLVTQIMKEVIGSHEIGSNDRFLDIGGNSLNLVQVLKAIKMRTGVVLNPRIFFDKSSSTITKISEAVEEMMAKQSPSVVEQGVTETQCQGKEMLS